MTLFLSACNGRVCVHDVPPVVTGILRCRSDVTRDKFEELASPILARAMKPCEDALAKAGISASDISAVEMVGAASRTPALVKTVAEVFKQEPKRCGRLAVSLRHACMSTLVGLFQLRLQP